MIPFICISINTKKRRELV